MPQTRATFASLFLANPELSPVRPTRAIAESAGSEVPDPHVPGHHTQDSPVLHGGTADLGEFSDKGGPIPAGTYDVSGRCWCGQ